MSSHEVENMADLKIEENVAVEEDFVDPWNVASKSETGIDYDKLIRKSDVILQYNANLKLALH